MKKEELNLSKSHVDQFKKKPKSYSGEKLVLTTAGWATVTQDGTIIEVLDAFPASQNDIFQQLKNRGEVESSPSLNENDLINPIDIGLKKSNSLNDSNDKNGELTLGEPVIVPLSVLISSVNDISSEDDNIQINWEEGSTNELEISLNVTGGSQSFLSIWEISYPSYRNGNYVNIGNSPSSFKYVTKQTIEAAIGKSLSIDEEDFIIKGTIRDFDTGETSEVFINVEYIRERISGRLTAALSQVNGLDDVSGDNGNKVGNWIEGQSSSIDTGVFVSGGRPPYTYKWQLSNRDVNFVDFNPAKDQATINITQRDITNTLGIPSVNGEFTLTCIVEDQEEDSNLVGISVLFIGE